MQSVEEVLAVIEEKVRILPVERVGWGAAWGLVLAEPVVMGEESPAFDRAQLDGYAVRAAEVREGVVLEVVGQVNAGGVGNVGGAMGGGGTCVAINTGAPMPGGGDAVLMVEYTEKVEGVGRGIFIRAKRGVGVGVGIQKRGSDAGAGEVVLEAGCRLWGQQLGICAAAGVMGGTAGGVPVRRVRVAVLTTGDELVEAGGGRVPGVGQIWNSNHPMLLGLVREATGGRVGEGVMDLGNCGDDAGKLRGLLARGLEEADLLVVSGGMSMGTKDLVPALLKELGVEFFVEKVRVKPGKPFIFGSRGRKEGGRGPAYVCGLPGNPVSAFVTFQRFVREVIARLVGETGGGRMIQAEAGAALEANGDREFYQPCALRRRGSVVVAEPLGWKGSADLFTLAKAQGLIVRAAGAGTVEAGAEVPVLLLA